MFKTSCFTISVLETGRDKSHFREFADKITLYHCYVVQFPFNIIKVPAVHFHASLVALTILTQFLKMLKQKLRCQHLAVYVPQYLSIKDCKFNPT